MYPIEFKSFGEIVRLNSQIQISEKIHGSNACVIIQENDGITSIAAASRTRIIIPDDDNFGFAKWVSQNSEQLIAAFGPGRHFGEWYGLGINAGYGLKEKRFALFDQRFAGKALPDQVDVVPVLYQGPFYDEAVTDMMSTLKTNGSSIAPGFTKPEGVVVRFERNGAMFKQVFEQEETAWKQKSPKDLKAVVDDVVVSALLQPIRLEKLLSRDERFLRNYPETIPDLAREYLVDLTKENQLDGVSDETQKALRRRVFSWIKAVLAGMGYSA